MKPYINALLGIFLITLCFSCKDSSGGAIQKTTQVENEMSETNHPNYVSEMEKAHRKSDLLKNGIVCFNLDMTFGKNKSLMKIFTTPNSSAIRVDKKDGASTVMVNGSIYSDADSTQWNREKFGVYTYQYFFMAPYKFSDEGTIWKKMNEVVMEGKPMERAMLTFEAGTGDAPDDWYIVYADEDSHLVQYIGYIVTGGGTSVEEAEKNAHAIKYSDYETIANIPFATKWEFFDFNREKGLGDKIGEGHLRNIELMDNVDQFEIINDGTYTKISE
ncbi:MAG: hypothetical protein P1U56_13765 [Saprospiraceae bacterium]|nr:hypothetical protein [Saprospiraceae bacterium]